MERHFLPGLSKGAHDRAWQLLAMQEAGLASFASCAWFFDELSRLEPLNAMTFALRALELAATTGADFSFDELFGHLEKAISNKAEEGTGKDIFLKRIVPRSITPGKIALAALCGLRGTGMMPDPGVRARYAWPGVEVEIELSAQKQELSSSAALTGKCSIRLPLEEKGHAFSFSWLPPDAPGLSHPRDTSVVLTSVLNESEAPALYVRLDEKTKSCSLADPCVEGEVATGRDLPSGARQLLIDAWLLSGQKKASASSANLALLTLGFWPLLESEQTDLHLAPLWADFVVHLLPLALARPDLLEESGPYLKSFIQSKDLSHRQLDLRRQLVTEYMLGMFAGQQPDWQALLKKREVLAEYMPDVELWAVQNALWELREFRAGNPEAARCFEAYGFAPQEK
jgi:hypothetical protein